MIKWFKSHLILMVLMITLGVLITGPLMMLLGDKLLSKDSFHQAETVYKLGKSFNLLKINFDQRLLAAKLIKTDRESPSEETEDLKTLASSNISNVLGASLTVPVLMYHYIRVNPSRSDTVGFNLSVTPQNFSAQMDYLASHGYHTISLDEMGSALFNNAPLPPKPIVLTFDDGYADSYAQAFPILRAHSFKATNFIITGLVGVPVYLNWNQIDEMKTSGVFTFGAHTVTHPALTGLSDAKATKEILDSKNVLQQHLGYPVNWLAYPYGNVNDRIARIVQQSGFVGAFGTNFGSFHSSDRLFTLPRVRVSGGDTIGSFAGKLPWK